MLNILVKWGEGLLRPLLLGVKDGVDALVIVPSQLPKRIRVLIHILAGNPILVQQDKIIPIGVGTGIATRLRAKENDLGTFRDNLPCFAANSLYELLSGLCCYSISCLISLQR